MIIRFGQYAGRKIEDIEDTGYLFDLAKKDYMGQVHIPSEVALEARRVLKGRGYKFIGLRLEYIGKEEGGGGQEDRLETIRDAARKRIDGEEGETGRTDAGRRTAGATLDTINKDDVRASAEKGKETMGEEAAKNVKKRARALCSEGCGSQALKDGLCWKCFKKKNGAAPYGGAKKPRPVRPWQEDAPMVMEGFGARVKAVRLALGHETKKGFAEAIGMDNTSYGRIEDELKKPKARGKAILVRKIHDAFPIVSAIFLKMGFGEPLTSDEPEGRMDETENPNAADAAQEVGRPERDVLTLPAVKLMESQRRFEISDMSGSRTATVTFEATGDGAMKFLDCSLELSGQRTGDDGSIRTTLEDWDFIGAVSLHIKTLAQRMTHGVEDHP